VRPLALVLALVLGACQGPPPTKPDYGPVEVTSTRLPLNPKDAAQNTVGQLRFAGALHLTAPEPSHLHGLSGLDVGADGQSFIAVTDFGDVVRGRLVLDGAGALTGVSGVTIVRLLDDKGKPFRGKRSGDAEGVSLMGPLRRIDGPFTVSFEQRHRVMAYAGPGAAGITLFRPTPKQRIRANSGMEAVAAHCLDPIVGGALWVGFEDGRISNRTGRDPSDLGERLSPAPKGYAVADMTNRDCEGLFVLYRAYDPARAFRNVITTTDARGGVVELARIEGRLTRANLEGIAAVRRGEDWRFYLVSDDGFDLSGPRTVLMAFDWTPNEKGPARPPALIEENPS